MKRNNFKIKSGNDIYDALLELTEEFLNADEPEKIQNKIQLLLAILPYFS